MPPSLSVVIPALNEEKNIEAAIQGVLKALQEAAIEDFEVLVATCPDQNGFLDGTCQVVQRIAGTHSRVRLLHSEAYQQLGAKYRSAVQEAQKEYVVMVPGDNENDSDSFPALFRQMGRADMVVSYTVNPHVRPWLRRALSVVYTGALNALFGRRMKYYNGINVYRRTHLLEVLPQTASFAYAAEILLSLLHRGATHVEVPVRIQSTQRPSRALRWQNAVGVVRAIASLFVRHRRTSATPSPRPLFGMIGAGFVGKAMARYFEGRGDRVVFYDPYKGYTDASVLANADVLFVAVPTPYHLDGRGFDDSFLRQALTAIPVPGKVVVLKTTMPPGTTDRLQAAFPQHHLLYNPEFLTESRADEDTRHPNRQIIGYTDKSEADAEKVLALLPRAPFEKIVPARVAEMTKCANNAFFATKVSFANQLYELCEKAGVPYELLKECIVAEPWMGDMHWTTPHKGYRGYGGKCLPKDARMVIQLGDLYGVDLSVLKEAERYNNDLVVKQGLDIRWKEGSPTPEPPTSAA